jgi:diguanylate cyclase (GGDEF)-like protein/PAS domain S-box-containing protein
MVRSPTAPSRRRLDLWAWWGVATLIVATVLVLLTALHSYSADRDATNAALTDLRVAVTTEDTVWHEPSAAEFTRARASVTSALGGIRAVSMDAAERDHLTTLVDTYQSAADREMAYLAAGDTSAASAYDLATLDGDYARLDTALRAAVDDQALLDQRATTVAYVASLGVVLAAAAVVAILVRAAATRGRRTAVLEIEASALAERERSFRLLFEGNPQPMWVTNPETDEILTVNEGVLALYGYTRSAFLALRTADLIAEDGDPPMLPPGGVGEGERSFASVRHRTRAGALLEVEITVHGAVFEGHRVHVVLAHDVTERLALQRELEHNAFHDTLTGLPNRALFTTLLEHAHLRLRGRPGACAVLVIDLDDFRTVNDSLGHDIGDQLLVAVSRRLAAAVRPGETAARVGGDEFAVLLEDLESEAEAVATADRLLAALREPHRVGTRLLTVRATIGIATSGERDSASDLVRNAHTARYAGKERGRDRHEVFRHSMHAAAVERLGLEQELREGLAREELILLYQPKVDTMSGRAVGVEALVRWLHPTRGMLSPDLFIPIAEQSSLILEVDAWVIARACRQAREWRDAAATPLSMAVNVSARHLEGGGLLELVRRSLDETGIDPGMLELEITEGAAVGQQEQALTTLRRLREGGVRIAIDDFGTGYSMLSRLQDFPVDTLKIDRSFVSKIVSATTEAPIVAATIAMARDLGLEVVAEGVETEAQRLYLARHGCDLLQGYLISPPVDPAQLTAMLGRPLLRSLVGA